MSKSYVTEDMRKSLENHHLERVCDGVVEAFYMKRKEHGRIMSTLVLFTPEGIVLQGDLTPQTNGSVSTCGGAYGRVWFSGQLSEGYLCEKFLRERWVHELAVADMHDPESWMREDASAERCAALDQIANDMDEVTAERLYESLSDIGLDCSDGMPGWGYDPIEAGWLCAIQQRFRELYAEVTP